MADGSPHRRPSPVLQQAWDWDLIVYPDGSLRVICLTHGCLYEGNHLGARCECPDRPRMSSPLVDDWGAPLYETPYDPATTGAGSHLLTARDGTEIRVLSGKTYRLNGPRLPAPNFSGASIWEVYRDDPPPPERMSRWRRLLEWLEL